MSIIFRLSYSVNDKLLETTVKPPVEFVPEHSVGISVRFSTRVVSSVGQLLVTATISRDVPSALADQFQDVAQGRLPKGSITTEAGSDLAEKNLLKPGHVPPLAALPPAFQTLCDEIHDTLYDSLRRTVDLIRWRGGLSSGKQHHLLAHVGFEFALDDGETWRSVPHRLSSQIRVDFPVSKAGFSQEIFDDVSLFSSTVAEPISRQLFREAWGLRENNPRSALVIGYAAIEIGCKEFIQEVVPLASWLVVEAPSPPVDRILKSYIPTLPSRVQGAGKAVIPDEHRRSVKRAMEARNELAHRGKLSLPADEVENFLRAVNDLLWLLNYHAGYEWALNYVSHDVRIHLASQK